VVPGAKIVLFDWLVGIRTPLSWLGKNARGARFFCCQAWPSTRLAFPSPPIAWCMTMGGGRRCKPAMDLRRHGQILVGSALSHSAGALASHHASTARGIHGAGVGSCMLGCSSTLGPPRSSATPPLLAVLPFYTAPPLSTATELSYSSTLGCSSQ
jgi:hypothetical protein